MALNGTTGGTAVAAAIAGLTEAQKQDPTVIWQTIMTAIYADIVAGGVVPALGLVAPSGGGAVTGAAKIT